MKKYLIFFLSLILIMGILISPRIFKNKDQSIKFKEINKDEVPEKIKEILPKYIMEERALVSKYRDDIYIIVTRGEKKSKGFNVKIEKIIKENQGKNKFELIVHAKFIDPKVDEALPQEYDYPYDIVKTRLKAMPEKVHLKVKYDE